MKFPLCLRPLMSFRHSEIYETWKGGNIPAWRMAEVEHAQFAPTNTTQGHFLEPITARFRYLDKTNPKTAWTEQLVGKQQGKVSPSTYGKAEMWSDIDLLKPYLEAITRETGDILHLAVFRQTTGISKPTNLRWPQFLVETASIPDAAKAERWSKKNLAASMCQGQAHGNTYCEYILDANTKWLAKWDIQFEDESALDFLISQLKAGTITQKDLISALEEINASS